MGICLPEIRISKISDIRWACILKGYQNWPNFSALGYPSDIRIAKISCNEPEYTCNPWRVKSSQRTRLKIRKTAKFWPNLLDEYQPVIKATYRTKILPQYLAYRFEKKNVVCSLRAHRDIASRSLLIKIHQVRCAFRKNPPTAIYSHCSWWVFGSSTLQLVYFSNQPFSVGGFSLGGVVRLYSTFPNFPALPIHDDDQFSQVRETLASLRLPFTTLHQKSDLTFYVRFSFSDLTCMFSHWVALTTITFWYQQLEGWFSEH